EVRGRRARDEKYFVLIAYDFVDCERHRGGRYVDDDVDLIDVNPGPHDVGANVRFVLMVGADDFHLHAFGGGAKILDRHPCRDDRALPAQIGIGPGHIVHHADLACSGGILRLRGAAAEYDGERRQNDQPFHNGFLLLMTWHPGIPVHTPRYSCSLSRLASSSALANRSMILPFSMT